MYLFFQLYCLVVCVVSYICISIPFHSCNIYIYIYIMLLIVLKLFCFELVAECVLIFTLRNFL